MTIQLEKKIRGGDKVVISKDLIVNQRYGKLIWNENTEYLKELPFVVVKEYEEDGFIELMDGWCITKEMIDYNY